MDAPDNGMWRSRSDFQQGSLVNDPIPESPSEVPMADVVAGLERVTISSTPPRTKRPTGLTPMERAQCRKDSSRYTTRILEIFNALEKQVPEFEKELEGFSQSPSCVAFHSSELYNNVHSTTAVLSAASGNLQITFSCLYKLVPACTSLYVLRKLAK
jgi:hypothetical protein